MDNIKVLKSNNKMIKLIFNHEGISTAIGYKREDFTDFVKYNNGDIEIYELRNHETGLIITVELDMINDRYVVREH